MTKGCSFFPWINIAWIKEMVMVQTVRRSKFLKNQIIILNTWVVFKEWPLFNCDYDCCTILDLHGLVNWNRIIFNWSNDILVLGYKWILKGEFIWKWAELSWIVKESSLWIKMVFDLYALLSGVRIQLIIAENNLPQFIKNGCQ